MNVRLLKSIMVLAGDENFVNDLARIINKSRATASKIFKGKRQCTPKEIKAIAEHYTITDENVIKIFVEGEK